MVTMADWEAETDSERARESLDSDTTDSSGPTNRQNNRQLAKNRQTTDRNTEIDREKDRNRQALKIKLNNRQKHYDRQQKRT